MAKKDEVTEAPTGGRITKPRAPQLRMPDEIAPKFGVQSFDDLQAQGVVKTDDIPALVGVFGLNDTGHITFPYQKHGASDGKRFELRVEPSGSHSVAGAPVVGHQWIFRQTYPELTA